MNLKEISASNFFKNSMFYVFANGAVKPALINLTELKEQKSQKAIRLLK